MDISRYYAKENEKPLDVIPEDGGFVGAFRTIGFIGDSLSSGEFEAKNQNGDTVYLDMFEYSWGQYMARKAGFKALNFSRGGMSASEYCESFGDSIDAWNPDKKCQAYVIALGVNDILNMGQEVGSAKNDICDDDCEKNAKTFTGYFAKIIQRMKKIQPDAFFFLMTMPKEPSDDERRKDLKVAHRKVLFDLAKHFENTYVLDFYEYAPCYDKKFKDTFFLRGHMNPMGYKLTADMTCAYIDYIIRHDPEKFSKAGLIGTDFYKY